MIARPSDARSRSPRHLRRALPGSRFRSPGAPSRSTTGPGRLARALRASRAGSATASASASSASRVFASSSAPTDRPRSDGSSPAAASYRRSHARTASTWPSSSQERTTISTPPNQLGSSSHADSIDPSSHAGVEFEIGSKPARSNASEAVDRTRRPYGLSGKTSSCSTNQARARRSASTFPVASAIGTSAAHVRTTARWYAFRSPSSIARRPASHASAQSPDTSPHSVRR